MHQIHLLSNMKLPLLLHRGAAHISANTALICNCLEQPREELG